jgi:hypothetical protein
MSYNCSNPDCNQAFDYRHGRLFRFHNDEPDSQAPDTACHCVRHFWLCDGCCRTHVLEYHLGLGVVISSRDEGLSSAPTFRPVCCCAKSKLSPCLPE